MEGTRHCRLPLVEHWDGASWTFQRIPLPPGASAAQLTGVSCPSAATGCTVVGGYIAGGTSGGAVPFAEHHGKAWTVQAMPSPAGATVVLLNGVSCTSRSGCTAVGWFNSGSGGGPLAERWDGTGWGIQADASPAGTTLEGVSCTSSHSCTAVGWAGSNTGVAEHWDGSGWLLQATPVPHTHTTAAELAGVSCRRSATAPPWGTTTAGSRWPITSGPDSRDAHARPAVTGTAGV